MVMKTIDPKLIKNEINKCYSAYDPDWVPNKNDIKCGAFKYHLEHTAGLKVDFEPDIDRLGMFGYKMNTIEIIDEPRFTMWLLKWA